MLRQSNRWLPGAFPVLGGLDRSKRVMYLLVAIVLMSVADLLITLVWVSEIGLAESNPLARWVIEQGSAGLLAAWKLVTIIPAVLVFAVLRHKPIAEGGAIVGFCVLALVTLHWHHYHKGVPDLVHALPAFESGVDERWTVLAAGEGTGQPATLAAWSRPIAPPSP